MEKEEESNVADVWYTPNVTLAIFGFRSKPPPMASSYWAPASSQSVPGIQLSWCSVG